ncbi:ATP-binding cassette domain-containing protein [Cellulomonas sp. URHE0023]|uniref:ATP-binding cassette domain-containing protein n=1 Tax=Cellulomonas sp. URHE0023 TaxID=1380354 RepID=UPI000488F856|nr:ATP-binding cassette domain-containing protein [Cellulomonas sp. URHE0023]
MITTRGLTKDFEVSKSQTVHAVRGIDLDIAPGELVAVLGPNGAGKTTTMRMLTTLVRPTAGTATVAGVDVVADPATVRRYIGYVGQGNGAGHTQHGVDELYSQGLIYGLDRSSARRRAHELVDALDLSAHATRKVSELSGGQRRRLDVALGLVHAPQLLFLDEPSTGLDPQNRANLWDHILRLRAEHQMTIVLTTHYLDEADTMAERVVVVDHGEIIADDTADGLKRTLAGDRVVLTTTGSAAVVAGLVANVPGARDVVVDGSRIEARVADAGTAVPSLVIAASQAGAPLLEALAVRPTLDDVFLALTGRSLRDEQSSSSDETEGQDAA